MSDSLVNLVGRQKREISGILTKGSVRREKAEQLRLELPGPLVKVVTGPRRAGKSTLIHQALQGTPYAYFNFEDDSLPPSMPYAEIESALTSIYPNHKILFFDEIQVYPRWEQLLNRLHRENKNIVVTGSNSKLLSSELASSLTGRHLELTLLPFSYSEYKATLPNASGSPSNDFLSYLSSGGFPDIVMHGATPATFLPGLWNSIVLKDVVQRYKIRRTAELNNMLSIYLAAMSCRLTTRSLERSINKSLSASTISKFLGYTEGAYLTFLLQNFSFKSRQRINAERKAYLIDNGFFTAHHIGPLDDRARLLENYVFTELLRRGNRCNLDFFYYQTLAGYEVDFLLLKQGRPDTLIQVCYSPGPFAGPTWERETRAIVVAAKETGARNLIILTLQEAGTYDVDGHTIQVLPVMQW